jgi:hypothetical protein
MTIYDLALEKRAEQIERDIYRDEYKEDLFEEIERMLMRAAHKDAGASDAIEDMTLADIIMRVAEIRAESRIETEAVAALELEMQEERRLAQRTTPAPEEVLPRYMW